MKKEAESEAEDVASSRSIAKCWPASVRAANANAKSTTITNSEKSVKCFASCVCVSVRVCVTVVLIHRHSEEVPNGKTGQVSDRAGGPAGGRAAGVAVAGK